MSYKNSYERPQPPYARKKKGKNTSAAQSARQKRKNRNKTDVVLITKIVFFSATIVGVLCMIIFNSMQITTLSDKTASLKKQLNSCKDENIQLKYQYDKVYSAAKVEEYAQTRLGMTIMDKNYIEYIELPGEDKVERPYSEAKGEFLVLSEIAEGIDTIVEYLN